MSTTDENLKAAFAGESQANRRYLAFAEAADKEGLSQVARLFRAAAEAETIHAIAHLKAMGGVGDTLKNLQDAVDGETHEYTKMYPGFIQTAKDENAAAALRMFTWAARVEEVHAGLFAGVREALAAGRKPEQRSVYVCTMCGNTVEGRPPEKCPVCGAPARAFKEIP